MNKSTKHGPGTAPSVIAEPLPKKGGGGGRLEASAPRLERKLPWTAPTVRILELERTSSSNLASYVIQPETVSYDIQLQS